MILAVDGVEITPQMDIYPLLNRKEGKNVVLTVQPVGGSDTVEQVVRAARRLPRATPPSGSGSRRRSPRPCATTTR
jgi:C-terminal processing protease CtpA/Prc